MNRSRISRSIVVILFVVFMCFLLACDIKIISSIGSKISTYVKVAYVFILVALVVFYALLKDKLYRMKIKRNVGLVYRYLYVVAVSVIASVVTFSVEKSYVLTSTLALYVFFSLCIGLSLKMVIFNVSKSDVLSVLACFSYSMLPNIINSRVNLVYSMFMTLFVILSIMVSTFLIDELKQIGIKTKKYILQSTILGILFGIITVMGVSMWVFVILAFVLIAIAVNLDNTHINFPKVIVSSVDSKKREKLYAIERININKVIVTITVFLAVMLLVNFGLGIIFNDFVELDYTVNSFFEVLDYTLKTGKEFIGFSTICYLVLISYILLTELLAFCLKRRYDTKTTLIKGMFMLIFMFVSVYRVNLILYQPIFTLMFILIAIINTSNIYLNREERVKLLVARK